MELSPDVYRIEMLYLVVIVCGGYKVQPRSAFTATSTSSIWS
jgi:hypothetical protein